MAQKNAKQPESPQTAEGKVDTKAKADTDKVKDVKSTSAAGSEDGGKKAEFTKSADKAVGDKLSNDSKSDGVKFSKEDANPSAAKVASIAVSEPKTYKKADASSSSSVSATTPTETRIPLTLIAAGALVVAAGISYAKQESLSAYMDANPDSMISRSLGILPWLKNVEETTEEPSDPDLEVIQSDTLAAVQNDAGSEKKNLKATDASNASDMMSRLAALEQSNAVLEKRLASLEALKSIKVLDMDGQDIVPSDESASTMKRVVINPEAYNSSAKFNDINDEMAALKASLHQTSERFNQRMGGLYALWRIEQAFQQGRPYQKSVKLLETSMPDASRYRDQLQHLYKHAETTVPTLGELHHDFTVLTPDILHALTAPGEEAALLDKVRYELSGLVMVRKQNESVSAVVEGGVSGDADLLLRQMERALQTQNVELALSLYATLKEQHPAVEEVVPAIVVWRESLVAWQEVSVSLDKLKSQLFSDLSEAEMLDGEPLS